MEEKRLTEITAQGGVIIISFEVVTISGVSCIEQVSRELREYITGNQPQKLVIDFCGVKFFSSQILGLLVDLWRKLTNYGGIMLISGIDPQLSRVFKITNLDKIFEFCPDMETAVRTINKKK